MNTMVFSNFVAIALALIVLVLWVGSCVWAYHDANRRGKPGVLIALLVALFWPLGLLLWVAVRPEQSMVQTSAV